VFFKVYKANITMDYVDIYCKDKLVLVEMSEIVFVENGNEFQNFKFPCK